MQNGAGDLFGCEWSGSSRLLIRIGFLLLASLFFIMPSGAKAAGAVFEGQVLSCASAYPGSKLDLGTQQCWSCPSARPNRTVFSVDGNSACERPAYRRYAKAIYRGRAGGWLRTSCSRGYFWDPNGNCYSCPSGMRRTTSSVTSNRACSRWYGASRGSATIHGKAGCPAGSFRNGLTNNCYSCPAGSFRNANIGNDLTQINACTHCGGEGEKPCPVTTLRASCDEGLAEDFIKGQCVANRETLMYRDAKDRLAAMGEALVTGIVDEVHNMVSDVSMVSALEAEDGSDADRVVEKTEAAFNPCLSDANNTWTLGVVRAASFGIGIGAEVGVAVDVSVAGRTGSQRPVYAYGGAEWTLQLGAENSVGVNWGCWRSQNNELGGDYHGVQLDFIAMAESLNWIVDPPFGLAVGFYYNPHSGKFDPANDYLGFVISATGGYDEGFTAVTYSRGTTGQVTGAFPPPLSFLGDKVFDSWYAFKDNPARYNEFVMQGPNLMNVRSRLDNGTFGAFHKYERKFFNGKQNVFVAQGSNATYSILDNNEIVWEANNGSGTRVFLTPSTKP